MKLPVVVVAMDSQDVECFDSPEEAARSMEAIDIAEGGYRAFDGNGVPLRVFTPEEPTSHTLLGVGIVGGGRVAIEEAADEPEATQWLVRLLHAELERAGRPSPEASAAHLIHALRELRSDRRSRRG